MKYVEYILPFISFGLTIYDQAKRKLNNEESVSNRSTIICVVVWWITVAIWTIDYWPSILSFFKNLFTTIY